ncbi:hypothetical protein R3P38DRAFT_2759641 [Favolaschia claudopus]|uniref:Uncharacterized protein n=1 Tax=Favolaschia claudopus TaxID=2862362 RepID=A0AAW0E0B2_9AGAR
MSDTSVHGVWFSFQRQARNKKFDRITTIFSQVEEVCGRANQAINEDGAGVVGQGLAELSAVQEFEAAEEQPARPSSEFFPNLICFFFLLRRHWKVRGNCSLWTRVRKTVSESVGGSFNAAGRKNETWSEFAAEYCISDENGSNSANGVYGSVAAKEGGRTSESASDKRIEIVMEKASENGGDDRRTRCDGTGTAFSVDG